MAIQWNFDASAYHEEEFPLIKPGNHRVRIANAEERVSSNGNPMIVLTLDVSGYRSRLWYNLVFLQDNQDRTNRNLAGIFSSFGITPGDLNIENWKGKVGAASVDHEKYKEKTRERVRYFISKSKQGDLPPWKDPAGVASVTGGGSFTAPTIDDDELPFD